MLVSLIFIFILLILVDSVYFFFIKNLFQKQIIKIQKKPLQVNFVAAFFCYVFLSLGIYYYTNKSIFKAFMLGIIIYGVYETTTKALLSDWQWNIVLIDTLWGGILFALVTFIRNKLLL